MKIFEKRIFERSQTRIVVAICIGNALKSDLVCISGLCCENHNLINSR